MIIWASAQLDILAQLNTGVYCNTVLEIMVSIQTTFDHFGILSNPKKFGSDVWLSTTSCIFHTHSDDTKSFKLRMSTYAFNIC